MKRQIINTAAALNICGICAAMTRRSLWLPVLLAMCAVCGQAQAQTPCSDGQTRLTKPGGGDTGCVADNLAKIVSDCEKAGWATLSAFASAPSVPSLICGTPVDVYSATGSSASPYCWIIRDASVPEPSCATMFGDPPVFPRAEDHPNLETDGFSASPGSFVANCDRDGEVPGGYPPAHNLNGETECSCDPGSHFGDWPNCVAAPDLNRAQREAVSACLSQGWTISTTTSPIKCEIPLTSGETNMNHDGCFFSGGAPLCEEVFGEDYAFPEEEESVRYVFNCGAGMIPARANTNDATECVRQTNLFLRLRVFLEGPLR